jgi:hypothetical protein
MKGAVELELDSMALRRTGLAPTEGVDGGGGFPPHLHFPHGPWHFREARAQGTTL